MEWRRLIQGNVNNGQPVPLTSTYGGDFTGALPANSNDAPGAPFRTPGCMHRAQTRFRLHSSWLSRPPDRRSASPALAVRAVNTKTTAALNPLFAAFNGNTLPLWTATPAALVGAGIFPAATNGNSLRQRQRANEPEGRSGPIDHNFTSKFSIFGHFIAEQVTQGFAISQWSGANVPTVPARPLQPVLQRRGARTYRRSARTC